MSYIPNCRNDKYYNQKYLDDKDAEFIAGFDWCTNMVVANFFYNMEVFDFVVDGCDVDLELFFSNHPEIKERFKENILEWIEMERDTLITSMLDNMDDGEYEQIKVEVDSGKRKNCLEKYEFEVNEDD